MDKKDIVSKNKLLQEEARLRVIKMKQFASGAIREDKSHKSRPDLISPYFTERLGFVLAKGATKHGERNWEKGIPDESALASLERHIMAYKQQISHGYTKTANTEGDDHLGQAAYNLMVLIHNQETREIGYTKNRNQLSIEFDNVEENSEKASKASD